MKTNRLLCTLLALMILIGTFTIPVMAEDPIKVLLNGTELAFDVPPQLINSRTMVPMRKIFEALGATVDWNDKTQTIVAKKEDIVIIMQINNAVISVSGQDITLDVPPQLVDSRTLVPVRAVAEGLDADVKWDGDTQTVIITKEEKSKSPTKPAKDPQKGIMNGYGNDGIAELQYNTRYLFEQVKLPQTIFEYEKETINYIKALDISKMKENILDVWELAAASVIVKELSDAEEEYEVKDEEELWKLIGEKRTEYGLGDDHLEEITIETLDANTNVIIIKLAEKAWALTSTYIAIVYNKTSGLNYFTLERSIDLLGDGNAPYMFCQVEVDSHRSLYTIKNDKQSFIDAIKSKVSTVITADSGLPYGAEKIGLMYLDSSFKMTVMLNDPDWKYQKKKEPEQVYFFNAVNQTENNLISISASKFTGDANQEIDRKWEIMLENHKISASDDVKFNYKEKKSIQVGEGFSGFMYPYEVKLDGTTIVCNALFWSTDEMIYTCTTSASIQDANEVQAVLDGILKSFIAL